MHPELATTPNNLAVLCARGGRTEEAQQLYARAIEVLRHAVEPDHRPWPSAAEPREPHRASHSLSMRSS